MSRFGVLGGVHRTKFTHKMRQQAFTKSLTRNAANCSPFACLIFYENLEDAGMNNAWCGVLLQKAVNYLFFAGGVIKLKALEVSAFSLQDVHSVLR